MTISVKTLFAGAALVSVIAIGGSASAATVIVQFLNQPFSNGEIGTIPATTMTAGNTYDFVFTMTEPLNGNTTSTQLQAQSQNPIQAQLIQYQLYSGSPGSGTFIAQSSQDFSPVLGFNASPGSYFLEVTPSEISKSGEVASGSVQVSAVPEPASWGLMLIGFGALGFIARRRAAKIRAIA